MHLIGTEVTLRIAGGKVHGFAKIEVEFGCGPWQRSNTFEQSPSRRKRHGAPRGCYQKRTMKRVHSL